MYICMYMHIMSHYNRCIYIYILYIHICIYIYIYIYIWQFLFCSDEQRVVMTHTAGRGGIGGATIALVLIYTYGRCTDAKRAKRAKRA